MEHEIWKDIKGYEGHYQVSNLGNVRCMHYGRKRQNPNRGTIQNLVQLENNHGYLFVRLFKDGIKASVLIHRLVAMAFIPNPDNKPQIDHINTNPKDNRVSNLRWVTRKENINNPITLEKIRKATKNNHIPIYGLEKAHTNNKKPVLMIEPKSGSVISEFSCAKEASIITGIISQSISSTCTGRRKTAGGFVWKHKI